MLFRSRSWLAEFVDIPSSATLQDTADAYVRIGIEPETTEVIGADLVGPIVVGKVLEKEGNFGFDAQNEEYGDMVSKGIIDPAKVVRIALQDAASVSSLLITTEAMIAEKPKDKAPMGMPPGGGMGGGMGGMDF